MLFVLIIHVPIAAFNVRSYSAQESVVVHHVATLASNIQSLCDRPSI